MYRSILRASAVGSFILLAAPGITSAEPIRIPLGAFTGTEEVVQFSVTTEQPLPYAEAGATFTYTPFGFVSPFFQSLNLQRPQTGGSGTLTVTFDAPILIAGFDLRNSFGTPSMVAEVFADLAGQESLGQLDFGTFAPHETAFVGVASSSLFTRLDVTWTAPRAASWFIDDFRFDDVAPVPEPGTISLTLLGIGLLARRVRHRVAPCGGRKALPKPPR